MAIQLARSKYKGAEKKSLKDLTKRIEEEQADEGKFQTFMGTAGSLAASLGSKAALMALTGATGGLAAPLLLGLGSYAIKKGLEGAGRGLGFGGEAEKIKSESKFGFGKGAAAEYASGLKKAQKEAGPNLIQDIGMSYVSALTPTIGPEGVEMESDLSKQIMPGGEKLKLLEFGEEGVFGTGPIMQPTEKVDFDPSQLFDSGSSGVQPADMSKYDVPIGQSYEALDTGELDEFGWSKTDPSNYQYGGMVQKPNRVPTISEYFNMQGKSLGGSHKQSVGQILGMRK